MCRWLWYNHYDHCDLLTSDKELDPSSSCYLFLKGFTLCLQISSISIKDVGVLCFYVYVLEEVIPHEGVVALRVISGKSCAGFYDSLLCKIGAIKNSSMCNHFMWGERDSEDLPTYSSMLNVFTYWNEISPFL